MPKVKRIKHRLVIESIILLLDHIFSRLGLHQKLFILDGTKVLNLGMHIILLLDHIFSKLGMDYILDVLIIHQLLCLFNLLVESMERLQIIKRNEILKWNFLHLKVRQILEIWEIWNFHWDNRCRWWWHLKVIL